MVKLTLELALGSPAPVSGRIARAMVCLGQTNQVRAGQHPPLPTIFDREGQSDVPF